MSGERSRRHPETEDGDEIVILQNHNTARTHQRPSAGVATLTFVALAASAAVNGCGSPSKAPGGTQSVAAAEAPTTAETSAALVAEGQKIFRFDTFGDEQVWTDTLRLHEVVEKNVDPTTALKVGLKVDAEALPPGILDKVDLKSPATTVALRRPE